jgi:hypothetical protein
MLKGEAVHCVKVAGNEITSHASGFGAKIRKPRKTIRSEQKDYSGASTMCLLVQFNHLFDPLGPTLRT